MKRRIALICAAVMLFICMAQPVGAVNVIMNSSFVKFPDQEPVVVNNSVLVPLRTLAETLGLEITWDDPSDTVVVKKDNFYVELVSGSNKAKTPGGVKTLSAAPVIINGRTMVPLEFIAEQFGLVVRWNQEYQRIVINGQVDTQTIVKPPVEETTDVEAPEGEASSEVDAPVKEGESKEEEIIEEETEVSVEYTSIDLPSSSILLEIPDTYFPEDTDNEEGFAFRSLDGFDAQHTYNWEIVSLYECYADEDSKNGILYIVQDLEPYQGEEFDISSMNQEYPEAPIAPERPQWPELDWQLMQEELERVLLEQIFIDSGVEIPEDLMELEREAIVELLGLESEEEIEELTAIAMENADLSQVSGYDEYLAWQEEQAIYNEEEQIYREEYRAYYEEYSAIAAVKNYAIRNFPSLAENASDEDWAMLFSATLNTDEEVRYENVEVLDFDGKKVVHAIIYAEDPDDEQGTYEYYRYQDGDTLVTIFGGTLFGSDPSPEISDILANMIIK